MAANDAWETALLNLDRTTITAPFDGVVTQRRAQVGQRIDPGQPLMSIAPGPERMGRRQLQGRPARHGVRIGQEVELTSDLYGA